MSAGLVISGILAGALAGFVGLISGLPIWAALLVYGGFGAVGMLIGAAIVAFKGTASPASENSLPIAQPDRRSV